MLYAYSPFPFKPGHNRILAALVRRGQASSHMNILHVKRWSVDDQIIINDYKLFMIMIFCDSLANVCL